MSGKDRVLALSYTVPVVPAPSAGGGCNVCGACCQAWQPDGPVCDACVAKQCSRHPALLVTAGGIETGQNGDGPPVAAVFAFDVVGAAWNNGTAAALPSMAITVIFGPAL